MKNQKARRTFLKTGVLAAGGAMALPSMLSAMSFGKERVRLGVIGTGQRGTGLINLANKIEGLDVVACADVIPFRLEHALKLAPGAKGYASHEGLLENKKVDAVIIATPLSTHDEIALAALDADKHVYCEKTMVKGIAETQAVITKAKATDKVFQTGHQYHSSPLYNRALEIIRSGYLGEITAYECQWNRNGNWRRSVPDPKWERMINWRMYREYSGGLVAELMSHQIDFINWVTESHPAKITGFGGIDHWKDGRETFDNVHLLFEYPSGLDASFECTTTNGFEDYQIKVLGKKGTMILDYTKGVIYSERKGEALKGMVDGVSGATMDAWQRGEAVPIEAPGNDPTLDALRQFYESITEGKPVISSLETGALTSKCVQISLDALYEEKIKYWKDYPELNFG
ncbi:Gfo/Idh/MocA family oxidoreductase [Marinoscillum furvescens]|uniref:Putative dehydrogenase n=1 Tax=Marinoscillum furvescens DSM 4134 TaxID=1122208 RepID=A0A3D9L7C6_MARFU|nr:Gfo/Idh/MocA family oxidoreductase [Marinoscillum furvescens]REE01559.1 putative dehydrogenase [Marinoscillum furvescens DSM 4134]